MIRKSVIVTTFLIIFFLVSFFLINYSKHYKQKNFENLMGFSLPINSKVKELHKQSFPGSSHQAYWVLIEGDMIDCKIIAKKLRLEIFPAEWGDLHLSPPMEVDPWWRMLSSPVENEKAVYHGSNKGNWSRVIILYKDGYLWCYFDGEYK